MTARRTSPCTTGVRLERLRKAEEFWRVGSDTVALADDPSTVADAATTLFVASGIAAADVICCARLQEFSQGQDHRQATSLLRQADRDAAPYLSTLLELKSKATYSAARITAAELVRAQRAAEYLLADARRLGPGRVPPSSDVS